MATQEYISGFSLWLLVCNSVYVIRECLNSRILHYDKAINSLLFIPFFFTCLQCGKKAKYLEGTCGTEALNITLFEHIWIYY